MAKILKPYEVPLDADLANEILNTPLASQPGEGNSPRTIGERVASAIRSVEEANVYLAKSPLAALVADTLMRRLKKRGVPSIRVRPDGVVILHVSYDAEAPPRTVAEPPVKRGSRKSDLPKLDELRAEAASLGLDITDLGRQRRAIFELVESAKAAIAEDPKPPARMVDEVTERDAPTTGTPRVIRRKRSGQDKKAEADDLDVDDLLGS
jgi:hypothetical protein